MLLVMYDTYLGSFLLAHALYHCQPQAEKEMQEADEGTESPKRELRTEL